MFNYNIQVKTYIFILLTILLPYDKMIYMDLSVKVNHNY
jgi:hypothetical protein